MKLKTLRKKIRRLETRLAEGPKKLAKLRRKLEALMTTNAAKARRKSAARAAAARQTAIASTPTQKVGRRLKAKRQVRPSSAKGAGVTKKVKKKLNLSPERREQLAAAMRARWAAKRAVAEANPQESQTNRDFALGPAPQVP